MKINDAATAALTVDFWDERFDYFNTNPAAHSDMMAIALILRNSHEEIARLRSESRGREIDERYASRLAFMLECAIIDPHGHFYAACKLLDEYKDEWEKVNPSPPTFMGEPIPQERRSNYERIRATAKPEDGEA